MPLPVGPVTSMIPCGAVITCLSFSAWPCSKPSFSIPMCSLSWSRRRSTAFSPKIEGRVDTRMSIFLPPTLISILPSWGRLFSAMSIPESILILAISGACRFFGISVVKNSVPSILILTFVIESVGSICMSEAFSLTDCSSMLFTRRTTGASSVLTVAMS